MPGVNKVAFSLFSSMRVHQAAHELEPCDETNVKKSETLNKEAVLAR